MKKLRTQPLLRILPFLILIWVVILLLTSRSHSSEVSTHDGLALLKDGKALSATIDSGPQSVALTLAAPDGKLGTAVQFSYVRARGPAVVRAIDRAHLAKGYNDVVPQHSWWASLAGFLLPALLIGGLIWFVIARGRKGSDVLMQFGRSRAKTVPPQTPKVTFADVAGADEAVEELGEIKDLADSTGGRTEFRELLRWCQISQGFAGSAVERVLDRGQACARDHAEVRALREVLA